MTRLSEKKRSRIKRRLDAGDKVAVVSRSEKVGYQTVWRIKHGVTRATGKPRKIYRVLTSGERVEIKTARASGWSLSRIAKRYDVAESTVSRVCSGATFTHASAR